MAFDRLPLVKPAELITLHQQVAISHEFLNAVKVKQLTYPAICASEADRSTSVIMSDVKQRKAVNCQY